MKRAFGFFLAAVLLMTAFAILPIHGEEEVYESVIRLHVLANSDSEEDQALKLLVRDAVLFDAQAILQDTKTCEEAEAVLTAHLDQLERTAAECLRQNGSADPVTVTLGEEEYPTRVYENLAFPSGEYLSLRVMIGEAAGQNWWCVLFPPLCLSAATITQTNEDAFISVGLDPEQYKIITETKEPKYEMRFKILEALEDIF